jgi:ABC-type nitrate/sulfonate/bicarbonate transport system ATPase subunit
LKDVHPAGGSALLEVKIDRKFFVTAAGERLEVLRDLHFTLDRGEVAAFVGPSGCGKTTMLRIIAGLDRDYRGHINRPRGTRTGMVFEEPRLLPWRSVEDNVRLVMQQVDETRLSALFSVLELTGHRAHYPGELSLGLARRVALARAFAIDPDILILDEPLASLDKALSTRLRNELIALVDSRSLTTLLVTHDVNDAARLGDRIFILAAHPMCIATEIPITIPRKFRTDRDIESLQHEVARRMSGTSPARDAS